MVRSSNIISELKRRVFSASLVTLVVCIVALWGYLASHHFVNLDPKDAVAFSDDAIVTTRIIAIPRFSKAYNPSMIAYGEGYLLSFRVDSYNIRTMLAKLLNHRNSFLGVVQLNWDFELVGKAQLIDVPFVDPYLPSAPQDARMIQVNEKTYLFFNNYSQSHRLSQQMFVAEVVKDGERFCLKGAPQQLHYVGAKHKIEKNWSPFANCGKLYAVYTIDPLVILEIDPASGNCTEVNSTQVPLNWAYGELRGGTPACCIDGQFLSFFHSRRKGLPSLFSKKNGHVFLMGAYTFELAPTFAITKITPSPLATPLDYEDNLKKVMYPGGLVVSDECIHVAWGKDDAQICITTFDKAKLLSSMVQIN